MTCSDTSKFPCKVCGKQLANLRNLRDHIQFFHESSAVLASKHSFPCSECDQIFYKKSNLTSHMLRHSSEKPFVCNDCGNTFKREKTLVMHFQLVHEGMRTELTCIHCGAQFMSQIGLRAHMGKRLSRGRCAARSVRRCSGARPTWRATWWCTPGTSRTPATSVARISPGWRVLRTMRTFTWRIISAPRARNHLVGSAT